MGIDNNAKSSTNVFFKDPSSAQDSMEQGIIAASKGLYQSAKAKLEKKDDKLTQVEQDFVPADVDVGFLGDVSQVVWQQLVAAGMAPPMPQTVQGTYVQNDLLDISEFSHLKNIKQLAAFLISTMAMKGVRVNNLLMNNRSYPVVYSDHSQHSLNKEGFILAVKSGDEVFASHPDAVAIAIKENVVAIANHSDAIAFAVAPFSRAKAAVEGSAAFAYGNNSEAVAHGTHSIAEAHGINAKVYAEKFNDRRDKQNRA